MKPTSQLPDDALEKDAFDVRRLIGLIGGPIVFIAMLLIPAPAGMEADAWRVAAVAVLMATFWICEAIPIPATALLPVVLFPLLKITGITEAAGPYAHPLIFLFMGGFMLALAMQRWNLHKRIALIIIAAIGTKPRSIVAGVMAAAAFLSMWVSNTATTLMLLPIAVSLVHVLEGESSHGTPPNFAVALMLGIAYAANIGGFGTLIGTPPNALLAAYVNKTFHIEIGFGQWMLLGVPLVVGSLPLVYWILTRLLFPITTADLPKARELVERELAKLGSIKGPEWTVGAVFFLTAFLWISRPQLEVWIPGLSDTGIALFAAMLLFCIPASLKHGGFVLNWEWAKKLPWGILILFGGGLSLADAINGSGLAEWIAQGMTGLNALPIVLIIACVAALLVFLTEITSNTAITATFLPILASVAIGMGENPLLLLVTATVAASCAFMMPVATPPNAVVFGSGYVSIPQMARAGLWLNLLFIVFITAMVYTGLPIIFGVEYGVLPGWAAPR